jgi:signal transduction histidine kinase
MHVLLIEDNAADVAFVRALLKEQLGSAFTLGHVVYLTEGLERLQLGDIDVVLLDLGLPDSQGLETIHRAREKVPDIPYVVLAGGSDEALGIKALQAGAQDYLLKDGLNGAQLARAIRYAVERRRMEARLLQAQKMEAIGRLAGGIAHDFNNLLTAILGFSDLSLLQIESSSLHHDHVVQIKKAAERAALLTRQLLTFSHRQVLQPRVLDLNAAVAESEKMLRRLIGEDITLTLGLWSEPLHVKADAGQLPQVIMNLVLNARDAMPQGGTVTVETGVHVANQAEESLPGDPGSGAYVVLTVRDMGHGMDAETRSHIFEPFFTTKGTGKGTGLGLAAVLGIVEQSHGYIEVESAPCAGSTFRVFLPRVQEAPCASSDRVQGGLPPKGTETVLLVEDEEVVRKFAKRVLEAQGYRVLEAANGTEGIRIGQTYTEQIHLLITDVVMPGLGGRACADRLLADQPGLKVLFISGYPDETIIRHGVVDAETIFLQKPFTPDALAHKVRETLDG